MTQTPNDVREKYSTIYSLGDVNPNTFALCYYIYVHIVGVLLKKHQDL